MKIKSIVLAITMSLIVSLFTIAQKTPFNVQDSKLLLSKLRSDHRIDRVRAFEQLKSDRSSLRNSNVRLALVELLDRESLAMRGATEAGDNGQYGIGSEEFAEYFSDLSSTVASIGDWNDPRQVCILVRGAGVPPSHSSTEAALRQRVAWPCLKGMLGSDRMLDRVDAIRIVIELSARAGTAVDPTIAQESKLLVVQALHDRNESVRAETIKSLEKFGTQDALLVLKEIAASDPAVDRIDHSFWLRQWANKAITAIQNRAAEK